MSEFDKFFDTIYSMLQSGEHILRQTARKMEKQENPLLKVSTDWKRDFPEFWDLLFKETEEKVSPPKEPDFLTVVYPDAFCRAIRLTKENLSEVFDWLYKHPGADEVLLNDDGKAFTLKWSNTTSGNTVEYTIGLGDYIIERFDCWEYEVYSKTSEDFDRNLIIIKD
jgi:hypothetical protein